MRSDRMNRAEAFQLTLLAVPFLVALLASRLGTGAEVASLVGALAGLCLALVLLVVRSVGSLARPATNRE